MEDNSPVLFDPKALAGAIDADPSTFSEFCKQANVSPKTVRKALRGEQIRRLQAVRLATRLERPLDSLTVKPTELSGHSVSSTRRLSLDGEFLTGDRHVHQSIYDQGQHGLVSKEMIARPASVDQVVSVISRARAIAISGEPPTPHPYYLLLPETPRTDELAEALESLQKALEARSTGRAGSTELADIVKAIKTEKTLESTLDALNACGAHVLVGMFLINLALETYGYGEINFESHLVPFLAIAPVTVSELVVTYTSLEELPKEGLLSQVEQE